MTPVRAKSLYHRTVGLHASALRRPTIAVALGIIVMLASLPFMWLELALAAGWSTAAAAFLLSVWPIMLGADAAETERIARRIDETRTTADVLVMAASAVSLFAVAFALTAAGDEAGMDRAILIGGAVLTIVLSWNVVNTVFTLRYARLHYVAEDKTLDAVDFGGTHDRPDYKDFAYLAYTIGMTYQVSDTNLRNRSIRRTVLVHALLSYIFGVVTVATGVNIVAGLI